MALGTVRRASKWTTAALVLLMAAAAARADDIVPEGAEVKAVARVAFLEGPAWHPDGNVYFSDVENNRILRRDVRGQVHIYRTPSGRANGLLIDSERRLIACEGGWEGGNRRVTRTERNGTITILADRYKGKRFNSPNDLAMDSQGRIYFTDPRYGERSGMELLDSKGKQIEGVYRIDTDGSVHRIITHEVQRPNGIAVSPGDEFLYVVDNASDRPDANRKVWRFDLNADGTVDLASQHLMHDFGQGRGGDGMALDVQGRLYVAAGSNIANLPAESSENKAGVYVLSPGGELVHFIPVPEDMVTNCTFGGADLQTLFITAGAKLWSVPVTTPGYVCCQKLPENPPPKPAPGEK